MHKGNDPLMNITEDFKKFLYDSVNGLPNTGIELSEIKKHAITNIFTDYLIKQEYFISLGKVENTDGKIKEYYVAGPKAVDLLNSWKQVDYVKEQKKFNKLISKFNLYVIYLAILSTLFSASSLIYVSSIDSGLNPVKPISFILIFGFVAIIILYLIFNKQIDEI